jgi:hypothetical protein
MFSRQPVNLLALRLQWFESTPAQCFARAAYQPPEPIGEEIVKYQWLSDAYR